MTDVGVVKQEGLSLVLAKIGIYRKGNDNGFCVISSGTIKRLNYWENI